MALESHATSERSFRPQCPQLPQSSCTAAVTGFSESSNGRIKIDAVGMDPSPALYQNALENGAQTAMSSAVLSRLLTVPRRVSCSSKGVWLGS
jgi:hypothetical protein